MTAVYPFLIAATLGLTAAAQADDTKAQDANMAPAPEAAGKPVRCITTDRIMSYAVESDETVRLMMMGKADVILRLKRSCPQLHYHGYIAYTPVNGQLCAKMDDIMTRTGLPCRIASLTEIPRGAPTPTELTPSAPGTETDTSNSTTNPDPKQK